MRILFLSHYFPPEVNAPATRTYEHCRVWARNGHAVSVASCVPNHPHGKIYPGFRNGLLQRDAVDGIRVFRMLTIVAAIRAVIRRTLNYFFYLVAAVFSAPLLPRADVVVSTSPQFFCGLAGYFVSRIKRARWVLEIRDLWPESIVTVGAMGKSRGIRMLEALERFAYRKADHIVSVTDSFVEHIEARGGAGKVSVVKNGVDLRLFDPDVADDSLAKELGLQGRFVASYVGTHGMAHGLDTILEAAQLLRDEPEIVFLMVGDGAEKERLKRRREALGLANVVMLDQQPKNRMPAIWALTGASLVLLRNQPLFRSVIPSKIFESLAMKRPIVLGVRGESERLVRDSGSGLCIEPENAAELAEALRVLAGDPARCRQMGEAGRRFVAEQFDRDRLAERYEAILESVVAAG